MTMSANASLLFDARSSTEDLAEPVARGKGCKISALRGNRYIRCGDMRGTPAALDLKEEICSEWRSIEESTCGMVKKRE